MTYNLQFKNGTPDSKQRTPLFRAFYAQWRAEKRSDWTALHLSGVDQIASAHLLPWFGERAVSSISRKDLSTFRTRLASQPGANGKDLSASRINKVMVILRQVMSAAALRYGFPDPGSGIRPLQTARPDVEPFTMTEAWQICDGVGEWYGEYVMCWFLTGMRTGEINGLRWRRVDFERGVLQIRETFSAGVSRAIEKSDCSFRDVPMVPAVRELLLKRFTTSKQKRRGDHVFTSPWGKAIDAKNFTNRTFYPALDQLGIARRRPYQVRHTTAALLMAAGEDPAWVAKYMGLAGSTTPVDTYRSYIPERTRQGGTVACELFASGWGRARSDAVAD